MPLLAGSPGGLKGVATPVSVPVGGLSNSQAAQATILLQTAKGLGANTTVMVALICAAYGESGLQAISKPNGKGYWGVLQGGSGFSGSAANFPPPNGWNDSAGMATAFCNGGKGFGNGSWGGTSGQGRGAIQLYQAGVTDPGTIATIEESSGEPPSYYGKFQAQAQSIVQAFGAGTLPNGGLGTGAAQNTAQPQAPFMVGDPSNPNEDYWTAINRIAQERYWYVFSDGETLYLGDGPTLMQQEPALRLNRLGDMERIHHLEFTWDNTAFQYVQNHKRRLKISRRTTLAKVQSPVQATLELICAIDEIRAGDVIVLSGCGPGDGNWLVGDCTRSVFQVYSTLTLVPALSPLTELQAESGGTTTATSGSAGSGTGGLLGYTNPVGQWSPSRVDMGVDGTITANYVALGNSKIRVSAATGVGWGPAPPGLPPGGYVAAQLLDGAYTGKCYYVAEGIRPLVSTGQIVTAGSPIAAPADSGTIETGWADPNNPGNTLAHAIGGFDGTNSTQAGVSFNRLLKALGASPGSVSSKTTGGKLPAGYP